MAATDLPRILNRDDVALLWSALLGEKIAPEKIVCDFLLEEYLRESRSGRAGSFADQTACTSNQFETRDRVAAALPRVNKLQKQLSNEKQFRVRVRRFYGKFSFEKGGYLSDAADGDRVPFPSSASALYLIDGEPEVILENGGVLAFIALPEATARKIEGDLGVFLIAELVIETVTFSKNEGTRAVHSKIVSGRVVDERSQRELGTFSLNDRAQLVWSR